MYSLAEQNEQQARLHTEAANLLGKGGLPQETAEEIFQQVLGFKRRSTTVSEKLYDQCNNESEFHLILCLGVTVLKEAKAWRLREELQPKKGEFKDLNLRTFKELKQQFKLATTTVNRNYNEAISYHKLKKPKSTARKGKKQAGQEEGVAGTSKTQLPESSLEARSDEENFSDPKMEIVEVGEVLPKVLLKLKQEPVEQQQCAGSKLQ